MTLEHIALLSPEGGVILLLLFFSLVTWSIGLLKLAQYARQRRRNQQFRQLFWQRE
ncbi:MotA/TolQ/ExbB proton channel family protein, partial [Dickeya dadantii]|nr:MotA/TolQ/ExbB proton channel family protein [Dickeya dadantii]